MDDMSRDQVSKVPPGFPPRPATQPRDHLDYQVTSLHQGQWLAKCEQLPGLHRPGASPVQALASLMGALEEIPDEALIPSKLIPLFSERILETCRWYHGRDVRVFGPAATGEDRIGDALDLVMDFERSVTMHDLASLQTELEKVVGIRVRVAMANSPTGQSEETQSEARPL